MLVVAADEESLTAQAAEKTRRSGAPIRSEGACALLLSADPAEDRLGALTLGEKLSAAPRLLSCGVPETLIRELKNAAPGSRIVLDRLPPPQWEL